jgi:TonB-linked SusC/RagA family outer membrane protein
MYDKIRKKYSLATNNYSNVCKSSIVKNGCKELVSLFSILILLLFSHVAGAQTNDISTKNMHLGMSLEDFMLEVESQTDFTFVYNSDKIKDANLSVSLKENVSLENLLGMILTPLGFTFVLYRDKIILKKQEGPVPMSKLKASNKIEAMKIVPVQKMLIGRVLCDEDSQPIVGASIRVRNENKGTASDKDGYYNLLCHIGDTIVVSAIGFTAVEEVVGLKMIEDIRLNTNIVNLQEVNVIGYGEEAKEEKTGAMSSVSTSLMGEIPGNFDETLAGTASGVWFQKTSGVPGGASTIAIRGVTSLQPDANSPLIVVDGVPLFSLDESLNSITFKSTGDLQFGLADNYVFNDVRESTLFHKNGINMLNTEDIESISILKDAYSTSIYGSRGAAGVVLITTKKPKQFGLKVNLLMETSISKPVKKPKLMNGKEYAGFYSNYYSQLKKEEVIFPNQINTNWYDKVVRNAAGMKYAISLQNKKHNGFFYVSFSHLNQEAYVVGADFKRYTGRLNLQQHLNNRIKVGANVSMTSENNGSLLAPKIYRDAILKAPNVPIYNADGDYHFGIGENPYGKYFGNPVEMAREGKGEIIDNYVISNAYAEVHITNWLKYKLDIGINLIETDAISKNRKRSQPEIAQSFETDGFSRKWMVTNTLTGKQSFKDHTFRFVLGQSFEESRQKEEKVTFEGKYKLTQGAKFELLDFQTDKRKFALASWFGRVNYNYRNKLFAGVSYRIDGSSRFGRAHRYQIFPAFSVGWNVVKDKENKILDQFKLRASFGYSGVEQSTFTYAAIRTFATQQHNLTYGNNPILVESNGSNLNIAWEKTKNFDVGIDFSLFENRLHGNIDYYSKKVNNLLLYTDVPAVSGYSKRWVNVGSMKNTGVELDLIGTIINTDVNWNVSLHAAYNRNKVLEINQWGQDVWAQDKAYKYFEEGKEAGQFYLFEWAGVNPKNGNPLWKYADGSVGEAPPSNEQDRKKYSSGMPKFTGGFSNSISYKGFELNAYFVFAEGKKLMNGTQAILHTYTTTDANNLSRDAANYWRNEGEIKSNPALFNPSITSNNNYTTSRTSSRYFEDASFIRLKSLVLAYHLPGKIVKYLKLDQAKLYVQATNLFTITDYSGVDPEVSAFGASSLLSGYDEVTMPQAKSFSLGIRISL